MTTQTPALSWDDFWRYYALPLAITACFGLSGCGASDRDLNFEPPPEDSWNLSDTDFESMSGGTALSGKTEMLLPGTPNSYEQPKPLTTLAMQGCSIKDRFDRKSTLAYNFSDQQSQLAFNLNARGPSLGDPTRFEVKGVEMRFTYQMQKYKKPVERCRFASPFQGWLGSAFNELALRENDTIMHELRAKGLDF